MIEKPYDKGYEGFNKRHRNHKLNLYDLVRWLEYSRTSGDQAARESDEQEQFWADQLKEALEDFGKIKCVICGHTEEYHYITIDDKHLACKKCNDAFCF